MSVFRCQLTRRILVRANSGNIRTHAFHPSSMPASARCFSSNPAQLHPRKDSQDKDSLNPRSSEFSQSGTDDAAANEDTAFNPNKTSPESQRKGGAEESGSGPGGNENPLEVSPGNPNVSQPRGDQEGGPANSPRTSASGGGSAPKSGGSKSG